MMEQGNPIQIFNRAKKNKYTYNVSTEAFSVDGRQFVLYNLSLKKDYSDSYDFLNYRRGLTYMEEIVNFQHGELVIARKGLRKFKDLMAEYLDIKESHVNSSKYHSVEKHRLFKSLQSSNSKSFLIYNTEKVNGQNAQITVVCDKYWLIGSKNKCLLVQTQDDLQKLKNKHEYRQTSLIARCWFKLLQTKTQQQIKAIKFELATKNLVGQYCNMENMQHLVNYGQEAHLFFYALVDKNDTKQDCLPLSYTHKFLETFGLPKIKVQIVGAKTFEHMIEKLRQIVVRMNEMTMKQGGEGSVIYVSGVDENGQHNYLVCKVKTIEYRIYRKLREKLKIYIQKYNKNYDNLLKKFTKEIAEIARQFNMHRPLDQYVQMAKRAFILCEQQSRPISKFIGNRFIDFLKLLQRNISKEKFMEIVNSSEKYLEEMQDEPQIKEEEQKQMESQKKLQVIEPIKEEQGVKQVIILIPLTIPSSGKTSVLQVIKKYEASFKIWSISSDECRNEVMSELMKKSKNMSKKQAFQKSSDRANKIFYSKMGENFKNISMSKSIRHVFFIDKNHPESAIKPCIKNIQQKVAPFKNIQLVKLCLIPYFQNRFAQKGLYNYPFSAAYVISCLKRVINRQQHLTLQGSEIQRSNIVVGFANLFRNFSLSRYNLSKYFDQKVNLILANEECLDFQKEKHIYELFKQVLLRGKPGKFDQIHPKLELFVQALKGVQIVESDREMSAKQALKNLQELFKNFDEIKFQEQKQQKKQ